MKSNHTKYDTLSILKSGYSNICVPSAERLRTESIGDGDIVMDDNSVNAILIAGKITQLVIEKENCLRRITEINQEISVLQAKISNMPKDGD